MTDWKTFKLDDLCNNITDGEHGSVVDDPNGKFYLLSNKNIINGKICYNSDDRIISEDVFKKINRRTKLSEGDIVFSTVGILGKSAIVKGIINYDFQRSVGVIKPNINFINTNYLYYYLNTKFVRKRVNDLSKGAVQKCFFISDLKNLDIHLPESLGIQKTIGDVLSAFDDKIELNNQINTELEAMAKTLYDYWFVQFDFPDENGKPYKSSGGKMVFNGTLKREIPEGWDFIEIETLLRKNESAKKVNAKDYLLEGNLPVIDQSTDFIAGFTNDLSYKIIYKDEPAIIFGDHTRILKLINFDFARGADGTQVIYSNNSRMPQYLFYYSLKKIDLSNYGYARHFKFLKSSKVLLPLKEPSKLFSDKVACFYKKIFINQKQNQELAQLRDWLLPMLMNGQVTVGDVEEKVGMVAEERTNYQKT